MLEVQHPQCCFVAAARLMAGEMVVMTPHLAVNIHLCYLPPHVSDVLLLVLRESRVLLDALSGLPVSAFHSLLSYTILALRMGVSPTSVLQAMHTGWPDKCGPDLASAAVLSACLDDDRLWIPETTEWRLYLSVLSLMLSVLHASMTHRLFWRDTFLQKYSVEPSLVS